jgi:hypothetical protein
MSKHFLGIVRADMPPMVQLLARGRAVRERIVVHTTVQRSKIRRRIGSRLRVGTQHQKFETSNLNRR